MACGRHLPIYDLDHKLQHCSINITATISAATTAAAATTTDTTTTTTNTTYILIDLLLVLDAWCTMHLVLVVHHAEIHSTHLLT